MTLQIPFRRLVPLDAVYTELTLQRLNYTAWGMRSSSDIQHYRDLFCTEEDDPRIYILAIGDPGIGKSIFAKKVAWDWAKGVFTAYSIVFFVDLKHMRPGDAIENVIIQQMPHLEALHLSPKKLQSLLQSRGSKCLLIFDGPALAENRDVLKVIRRKKYLNCSVLVTSRPHSIDEIQSFADIAVRVKGFSLKQAEVFATKFFDNTPAVQGVLNFFYPIQHEQSVPVYKSPTLLALLCLLVRGNYRDDLKKVPNGQIYMDLIRCLYKRQTYWNGLEFEKIKFHQTLLLMGKFAFKMLLTKRYWIERSEAIEEVGPDALDYGLIVCEDDVFREDILMVYFDPSFQDCLGAFYFIRSLDEGQSVESLLGSDCKKPILLMNQLFLHSCLWLVMSDQLFFDLENAECVYNQLLNFATGLINPD